MLLKLTDTTDVKLQQLLDYAKQNSLELTVVNEDDFKTYLPGKKMEEPQLNDLIELSRESGKVNLKEAHDSIRKKLNDH
jgi:hypothetical protein